MILSIYMYCMHGCSYSVAGIASSYPAVQLVYSDTWLYSYIYKAITHNDKKLNIEIAHAIYIQHL